MHPKTEFIAERVTQEHGYDHKDGFNDPSLGPPLDLNSRHDFKEHIAEVLESPDAKCFTAYSTRESYLQADVYYHPPSNTAVVLPEDKQQSATAFRPKAKEKWFDKKLAEVERREQIAIEVKQGGISKLHPLEVAGRAGLSQSVVANETPSQRPAPKFLSREMIDSRGGEHRAKDGKALEETIAQAQESYNDPQADLYDVAAGYACSISENQPYKEGNKRTGVLAAATFLEMNGIDTSRLREDQTYETVAKMANHEMSRKDVGEYFRSTLSREKTAEASQGAGEAARTRAAERQGQQQSEQER